MSRVGGEDLAFLQAIRESPEEDAPRLVYADWLEEHDDLARATFIRVQCELAQQPAKERRAELEAQERTLLAANRNAWLGPLAKELPNSHCTFRRGFPEDLTVPPTKMVNCTLADFRRINRQDLPGVSVFSPSPLTDASLDVVTHLERLSATEYLISALYFSLRPVNDNQSG